MSDVGYRHLNVIEETERTGIMIKQDACAKLDLVFSDKIRNSEAVSLLTAVGLEANGMVDHACELLAQQDIAINFCSTNALTMMLVLPPMCVDAAANILHDAYVTSSEALNIQQNMPFGLIFSDKVVYENITLLDNSFVARKFRDYSRSKEC